MVKRAKNPAQLTEEEKDMINQIILRWGGIYLLLQQLVQKNLLKNSFHLQSQEKKLRLII
jgi:hypothetical protein